jgi:hypothetical protein
MIAYEINFKYEGINFDIHARKSKTINKTQRSRARRNGDQQPNQHATKCRQESHPQ